MFGVLNRFSAWMHRTRPYFRAHAPLPIRSARDIVAWRAAVRVAAKQGRRNERLIDDLSYVEEVLYASWKKLEALHEVWAPRSVLTALRQGRTRVWGS
jgi:hypothetical protein